MQLYQTSCRTNPRASLPPKPRPCLIAPRQLPLNFARESIGNFAQVTRFWIMAIGHLTPFGKLMAMMAARGRIAVLRQLARWPVQLDAVLLGLSISPKLLYAPDPKLLAENTRRADSDKGTVRPPYANRAVLNAPWIAPAGKKPPQSGQDGEPGHIFHDGILQISPLEGGPVDTFPPGLLFHWGDRRP